MECGTRLAIELLDSPSARLQEGNLGEVEMSQESMVVCAAGAIQLVGLLSLLIARITEGTTARSWAQLFFVFCLAMIGVITMCAIATGNGCWASCATTLSVMCVGVTLDLRRAQPAAF